MSAKRPRPTPYVYPNEIVVLADDGLPWHELVDEWELENQILSNVGRRNASMPRPKRRATHRSITIKAMRHYRYEDSTLEAFLNADLGGRITITPMDDTPMIDKKKRFMVDCDAIEPPQNPEKVVSLATLREWWTEAGKLKRS